MMPKQCGWEAAEVVCKMFGAPSNPGLGIAREILPTIFVTCLPQILYQQLSLLSAYSCERYLHVHATESMQYVPLDLITASPIKKTI